MIISDSFYEQLKCTNKEENVRKKAKDGGPLPIQKPGTKAAYTHFQCQGHLSKNFAFAE